MARMRKDKGEKPKVSNTLLFPSVRQYPCPCIPPSHLSQVTSLPDKPSINPKDDKKSTTSKAKSSKPSQKDELKQNVLALGGTLADLDLVKDSEAGEGGEFKDDGKVDVSSPPCSSVYESFLI